MSIKLLYESDLKSSIIIKSSDKVIAQSAHFQDPTRPKTQDPIEIRQYMTVHILYREEVRISSHIIPSKVGWRETA